jgi:carbon storage regulator
VSARARVARLFSERGRRFRSDDRRGGLDDRGRNEMLVLTRKCSEKIQIGSDIRVTVVRLSRGYVRLGIEAPPNVSVLREELVAAPQRAAVLPPDQGS